MGLCSSRPSARSMLVAVPVPVTIADCALLSDRSLQTLLQVIMVEGDAVVADWNAEAASAIGAMQKAAKKSEAAADALRPSRLREEFDLPYAIIVREPIEEFDDDFAPGPARRARVPHSAADIEDVERHVVRIVDSRAESRALLYSLQLLVRSQPLRFVTSSLVSSSPNARRRDRQRAQNDADRSADVVIPSVEPLGVRDRAAAFIFAKRSMLKHIKITIAEPAPVDWVNEGVLTTLTDAQVQRLMTLFNDFDVTSQGWVMGVEVRREASRWVGDNARSVSFGFWMSMARSRKPGRLLAHEFAWCVHNLCVANREELVRAAFECLGDVHRRGGSLIDLDRLEDQHAELVRDGATEEDRELMAALLDLRDERLSEMLRPEYNRVGRFVHEREFTRLCAARPKLLRGFRAAQTYFRNRTFGDGFWDTRSSFLRFHIRTIPACVLARTFQDGLLILQRNANFARKRRRMLISVGIPAADLVREGLEQLFAHEDVAYAPASEPESRSHPSSSASDDMPRRNALRPLEGPTATDASEHTVGEDGHERVGDEAAEPRSSAGRVEVRAAAGAGDASRRPSARAPSAKSVRFAFEPVPKESSGSLELDADVIAVEADDDLDDDRDGGGDAEDDADESLSKGHDSRAVSQRGSDAVDHPSRASRGDLGQGIEPRRDGRSGSRSASDRSEVPITSSPSPSSGSPLRGRGHRSDPESVSANSLSRVRSQPRVAFQDASDASSTRMPPASTAAASSVSVASTLQATVLKVHEPRLPPRFESSRVAPRRAVQDTVDRFDRIRGR